MPHANSHRIRIRISGFALLGAVALALLGTPALAWDWTATTVVGSGHVTQTQRPLQHFKGVSLELPAKVEIVQDGTESVLLETDDNMAPLIETLIENDQLKIRQTRHAMSLKPTVLKLTVHARAVERIAIAGSGTLRAEKLQSATLDANISGSGDMRIGTLNADVLSVSVSGNGDLHAAGRADTVRANIAGSGNLKTGQLVAKNVKLSIAGSGDAEVWASQTLNVSIAGSGDVGYYGDAAVTQAVAGSGRIRKLGTTPSASH